MQTSPALWGVGSYADERGRRTPRRISHDEIGRDIGVAVEVLTGLELTDKRVLWCSMLSEAGQFWPYVCGTVMAGSRLSCADSTYGEAMRVSMFLRLMDYVAVFGVTEALLDGIDAAGHSWADVFAGVRLLGAYPGAYQRLVAAGLAPVHFVLCGPAIAIGRETGGPAFVPGREWELAAGEDHLVITSLRSRAQPFIRTPIAVRGTIVGGGVVPAAPYPSPTVSNPVGPNRIGPNPIGKE
jgi:hypothetical protein